MKTKTKEIVDTQTGEIQEIELNKVIIHETKRDSAQLRRLGRNTRRIQMDYSHCINTVEQHQALSTDLNFLMEKYAPDDLAAYIFARTAHKRPINPNFEYDFASEPNLQESMNIVYELKQNFEALPPELKSQFRTHLDFLKFIDNPKNEDQLVKLGVLTRKEINDFKKPVETTVETPTPTRTTTQEEATAKEETRK